MDMTEPSGNALFDLAVIGGGPAGTAAAIIAARAGSRVLLLERGRLPRQRVCGEFVSAESLALLASLLSGTAAELLSCAPRIARAWLFFDGHAISAPVDPPAASIARFDLDAALWLAAKQAGVDARLETTVQRISGDGPFTLSTGAGEFRAQALVNASGRWSNLRQQDGTQTAEQKWLGIKSHYAEKNPPASVDLYFFEGGYCGVQPVAQMGASENGHRVNACALVRSDVAHTLAEVFALHPDLRERARHWQPLMEPVRTSPLVFGEPQAVRGAVLQAGDAAGFVDPFVGGGISLALRGGTLAAQCLASFFARQTSLPAAATAYAQAYRRQLLPVFRTSSNLRHLLGLPRPVRRAIGRLLETAPAVSRLLVRMTR